VEPARRRIRPGSPIRRRGHAPHRRGRRSAPHRHGGPQVGGWAIPAGTLAFLSTASANRDESAYDDAATFDINADRVSHLTFGGGPHYCLGANLARAEMEEALRVLPSRLRNIQLDGEPSWRQGTGITGPSHLLLRFKPAR
jgi:cytochrome P450